MAKDFDYNALGKKDYSSSPGWPSPAAVWWSPGPAWSPPFLTSVGSSPPEIPPKAGRKANVSFRVFGMESI